MDDARGRRARRLETWVVTNRSWRPFLRDMVKMLELRTLAILLMTSTDCGTTTIQLEHPWSKASLSTLNEEVENRPVKIELCCGDAATRGALRVKVAPDWTEWVERDEDEVERPRIVPTATVQTITVRHPGSALFDGLVYGALAGLGLGVAAGAVIPLWPGSGTTREAAIGHGALAFAILGGLIGLVSGAAGDATTFRF